MSRGCQITMPKYFSARYEGHNGNTGIKIPIFAKFSPLLILLGELDNLSGVSKVMQTLQPLAARLELFPDGIRGLIELSA